MTPSCQSDTYFVGTGIWKTRVMSPVLMALHATLPLVYTSSSMPAK
eukprot:CAMPEP_0181524530 /NCGR_PEP_ID=MMETSP1110-20121109/68485_1 /TAXON_ID=174948 /ORGANISM="Symbiodinium sp., Strain CCMP421" /LENGTH=45 /DNA_ID= /DNA_START= /DNA_END= /DNA_ORIENTATION=